MRQIRCIRRSLPRSSLATLITAFILSKVDYCNVVLSGLPQRDLERVQSVINAAARLTNGARKYDQVMPLLKDLHWLRVPERITYKLCVLVHNCLHRTAPRYLQDVIQPVAVTLRRRLRSTSSSALVVPVIRDELRSETELSPSRDLEHGTVFLSSSPTARLLAPSENI